MEVGQLVSYLPIAAPARRAPASGTEGPFRAVVGFEPKWFTERFGMEFTARWHTDPLFRAHTLERLKAELIRRFPEAQQWDPDDPRDVATLSGCYGAYLIPHACGLPLRFAPDRYPLLERGAQLSLSELAALRPEEVLRGRVVEDILRQIEILKSRWGLAGGYLNWQGVLNNAFHLRSYKIFLDLYDRPGFACDLFEKITQIMISTAKLVHRAQSTAHFSVNHISVSNCLINMISPEDYGRFLLAFDRKIACTFERFGVHTCNWNVTPYLPHLKQLPNVGYLDMGIGSDLAQAKAVFPKARRAVIYSPVWLEKKPFKEIRRDCELIARELGPCDVVMADISWSTPDERVRGFITLCRRIEQSLG